MARRTSSKGSSLITRLLDTKPGSKVKIAAMPLADDTLLGVHDPTQGGR
ncbi:hypothetical protein [Pseudomonas sp.]|nr:hypothetical protein [Pseudomonas sp.]